MSDDKERGLYKKFHPPERTDGRSAPGEKHHGCDYFMLDLTHDPHALPAIQAYAASCRVEYPQLVEDLLRRYKVEDAPEGPTEAVMTAMEETISEVLRFLSHDTRIVTAHGDRWRSIFRDALNRVDRLPGKGETDG